MYNKSDKKGLKLVQVRLWLNAFLRLTPLGHILDNKSFFYLSQLKVWNHFEFCFQYFHWHHPTGVQLWWFWCSRLRTKFCLVRKPV